MDGLTDTTGIVALAAAGVALAALVLAAVLAVRLRRLRAAQTMLLGDDRQDLVAHAAGLQRDYAALHAYVEDTLGRLHERYDAYGEMSGRQSTTLALLDARRSGLVLSSIHHRDSARIYAKQVHDGKSEIELSPEEDEAVRAALNSSSTPE